MKKLGFTLIETLVAIALLTVAIVAPMSLTSQSLSSAYYARDQVTAFYLAQEAIEALRSVRDGNILKVSQGEVVNLLSSFPDTNSNPFTIDARNNSMQLCPVEGCPPLQTDSTLTLYGYSPSDPSWTNTNFTRTVRACFVHSGGTCDGSVSDEVRLTVQVQWITGGFQTRSFTLVENLYRWVNDGSGIQ
ncbi:MAG: hypothetical protein RIQ56_543 [Candidatus Parcubacteria bacterium]